LTLGKAKKQDHASKVLRESGAAVEAKPSAGPATVAPQASARDDFPINVKIEEKISVNLNRDGGVKAVDISGTLTVTVVDGAFANVRVHMCPGNGDFAFKTHPNINRALYVSDNVLGIKDNRPFPLHQPTGILRWRAQELKNTKVPLTINCWPSSAGAAVEFELENKSVKLANVQVSLPLAGAFPEISSISCGSFQHDSSTSTLVWIIPTIDGSNASGSMEVSLNKDVGDQAFFPASVSFVCSNALAGVKVVTIANVETQAAVPFGTELCVGTDVYTVE
jgi:hypothetical protein